MRAVYISEKVWNRMNELEVYLTVELKLSRDLAFRKTFMMREFIHSLGGPILYAKCRFREWAALGYRCAIFEKSWIFAYEVFDEVIIVRDMKHGSALKE